MSDGAYNEGLKAYLDDDFAGALAHWLPLARAGHGPTAFRVGQMSEFGQGLPRDPAVAATWYEKGALAGDSDAMAALGMLYLHGLGVSQSYADAYLWLSMAAACGKVSVISLRERAASQLSRGQLTEMEHQTRRRLDHLHDR